MTNPTPQDQYCSEYVSRDTLFDGELICMQNVDGYRFSVDSVLLAHFVTPKANDHILDLGTGCGIIMLILLYKWPDTIKKVTGVEVQKSLAGLARQNIIANRLEIVGNVVEGSVKNILSVVTPESFQRVVCNPPFYRTGSGRHNSNEEAMVARHQILANLDDFLKAAASSVKNKGDVFFIYPADLIGELIWLGKNNKLEVKKLQFVYSYPGSDKPAMLVLVHFRKNGGVQAEVMAPFYIYSEKNGSYSSLMKEMYAPKRV